MRRDHKDLMKGVATPAEIEARRRELLNALIDAAQALVDEWGVAYISGEDGGETADLDLDTGYPAGITVSFDELVLQLIGWRDKEEPGDARCACGKTCEEHK